MKPVRSRRFTGMPPTRLSQAPNQPRKSVSFATKWQRRPATERQATPSGKSQFDVCG